MVGTIPELRDLRAPAHQAALNARDRGRLFAANVETTGTIMNRVAFEHGGSFDLMVTHGYLLEVTDAQLEALPYQDGVGSASRAAAFGVREFVRQDWHRAGGRRRWLLTWRHTGGGESRDAHVQADGQQIEVNGAFGVSPGIGAPGCRCWVEPTLA